MDPLSLSRLHFAFRGFYLPLMIVLWLLMLRGLAVELRSRGNAVWAGLWDALFCLASALRGVVTLVQEERFRLEDDLGRGYLFTLGRGNGVSLGQLHAWCVRGAAVEVEYRGAPDLGAVAAHVSKPPPKV